MFRTALICFPVLVSIVFVLLFAFLSYQGPCFAYSSTMKFSPSSTIYSGVGYCNWFIPSQLAAAGPYEVMPPTSLIISSAT